MSEKIDVSGLVFTKEYVQKLYEYKGSPEELRDTLYPIFASQYPNYKGFPKHNIDPFTAIAVIHRGSKPGFNPKKIAICEQLKTIFNINSDVPTRFDSIPTFDTRQTSFTTENEKEKNIDVLWESFRTFCEYSKGKTNSESFIESFNRCYKLGRVGRSRLTTVLYWIDYRFYISLDSPNENYLKKKGNNTT